jgi:hypothetical protein
MERHSTRHASAATRHRTPRGGRSCITDSVIRAPGQSDFVVQRPAPVTAPELPPGARAVALPEACLRSSEASAFATRWVMRAAFLALFVLLVLTVVGTHIPSGE